MDDEPDIPMAEPKQGLETGSLEGAKGGLSAKQKVARAYEKDLAGDNGPDARFDAMSELIGTKIREAVNALSFASPGGTSIFGRDGKFSIAQTGRRGGSNLRRATPADKSGIGPWDILGIDAAAEEVVLNPGTILTGSDRINDVLTCANPTDALAAAVGGYLAIKITSTAPTSFELVDRKSVV